MCSTAQPVINISTCLGSPDTLHIITNTAYEEKQLEKLDQQELRGYFRLPKH